MLGSVLIAGPRSVSSNGKRVSLEFAESLSFIAKRVNIGREKLPSTGDRVRREFGDSVDFMEKYDDLWIGMYREVRYPEFGDSLSSMRNWADIGFDTFA